MIIEIIRGSKKREDVLDCFIRGNTDNINFKSKESKKLAKELNFTEAQADAIMKMQLQRLVGLELDKLNEELDATLKSIEYFNNLLNNEQVLKDYAVKELENIKKEHGRNRKTQIVQISEEEEYVEEEIIEDVYALVDRFNYVKVVDTQSFSRTNQETLDSFKYIIETKSNDNVCFFGDDGNFHQLRLEDLPVSKMKDRGTPIPNDINILFAGSKEYLMDKELLFTTKEALVKRVDFEEFDTIRREIIATKLNDDDKLIGVHLITDEKSEVVLVTKDNRKIRFDLDEVSKLKKNAAGVIGINLNQGDYVVKVSLEKETSKDKRKRGAKGAILD